MVGGLAAMVVMGSAYANLGGLAMRMRETTEQGEWGRPVIWHDTWRMVSDFPLTGVGAGAFQRAMLVYQEGSRLFFFNHAHNEYLQLLAEGGLLIALPAAIALVAAVVLMLKSLGADRSPIFWARAGAACGVLAVAVQSIWDTGLRTPANGVLFAVIAAIALHERPSASDRSDVRNRREERSSAASRAFLHGPVMRLRVRPDVNRQSCDDGAISACPREFARCTARAAGGSIARRIGTACSPPTGRGALESAGIAPASRGGRRDRDAIPAPGSTVPAGRWHLPAAALERAGHR
jgi:hypothetical protein